MNSHLEFPRLRFIIKIGIRQTCHYVSCNHFSFMDASHSYWWNLIELGGYYSLYQINIFILKFGQNQKSPEKMDFSGFTFTSHFRPLVVVSKTLFNQPNIYRNSTIFQRGRFIFDDFQFWPNPTLPTYILIKQKVTLPNFIINYICPYP